MFRCRACRQACNERTNTPYNHLQVHTDIAVLVVPGRLQDKLSLRNVAEMVLTRGFTFTHETAPVWEERFAPLLTARLKARRRGKAGRTWHVDETDVKVAGRWCSLYRAINADGNLVETMLSKTRDMEAAKRFFAYALQTVGQAPEKVTTDGHDSYPRAVRETLGPNVCHGASRSMNNRIEQDHGASSSAPIPCAGSGPSTLPPDSARPMTNSVTTSARAPASTTPSPHTSPRHGVHIRAAILALKWLRKSLHYVYPPEVRGHETWARKRPKLVQTCVPHVVAKCGLPRRATSSVSGALGRGVRAAPGGLTTPATGLPPATAA